MSGLFGVTLRRLKHGYETDSHPSKRMRPGTAAQLVIIVGIVVLSMAVWNRVDLTPARALGGAALALTLAAVAAVRAYLRHHP